MKQIDLLKMADLSVRLYLIFSMVFVTPALMAAPGETYQTPVVPMELPIEVEIELSPAGSLKQAALWKELVQLLENPYDPVERRPSFNPGPDGVLGTVDDIPLPPLNIYDLDYNFLTGQLLRLRTSDGEVCWDVPGPLFDPNEVVATGEFNTPTELRTVIGHLVVIPNNPPYESVDIPEEWVTALLDANVPENSLVVYNPDDNDEIPPDGTVVAVPAYFDGMLHELEFDVDGVWTGEYEALLELEMPVNEEHFLREEGDNTGIEDLLLANPGLPTAREAAEVLGKALFWDMQIGSDGIQACASCHFNAGADNRTRNQLNPNHLGGDTALEIFDNRAVPPVDPQNVDQDVVASDFPFHKLIDPEIVGEPLLNPANVTSDANDIMSSMGVVFHTFVDIPTPGPGAFGTDVMGVAPLLPDIGVADPDPIPLFQGVRRVEPRNTPTFHGPAFNLDNFWDGRARFNFNGGSVFGPSDPFFHIFVNDGSSVGALHGLPNPSEESIDLSLFEWIPEVGEDPVPARIKFCSLASQAVGPPLSEFEMSFLGRNWPKIGKKMLQEGVVPLANQLVHTNDSVLGDFSNQNSSIGMPGLDISYNDLIKLAFSPQLWANTTHHLNGTPDAADPFDGYVLSGPSAGGPTASDTNQFSQMEANFSLFFGLSVQMYEELTIPDDTPADKFFDANPNAGHAVGEPGDQAVLFPTLIKDLLDDGELNNSGGATITLIPDDPTTPEYDGFGPDEVFGFDLFAGSNLTAALAEGESVGQLGIDRNPAHTIMVPADGEPQSELEIQIGSNPFTRSAKCMLCHLGPEQTDHSINIAHGVLKNNAEFEYPTPPRVEDPLGIFAPDTEGPFAGFSMLPAPEPSGNSKTVPGLILSEEVTEGPPQDAVEVEPRNFATFDDPDTPWDDRVVAQAENFAFGDQGVYNIGVRPIPEDLGRGDDDVFGWPLSLSALTLKNIGGPDFEPYDSATDPEASPTMANFDPEDIAAEAGLPGQQGFEETGNGAFYPAWPPEDGILTTHTLQSVNPGFERDPIIPLMPDYMVPWINHLPAGELHPQIDEMAGMVPNTLTPPNGGPGIEFPEIMFGADLHVSVYDPDTFGSGPPAYGWGTLDPVTGEPTDNIAPNNQSGVPGNMAFPSQGTWPVPNRVLRDGAFKAPPLRNTEMTGPYFRTGSYLTLRQVVDFYFRGGDFPITNKDSRDPHIVDLDNQAFAFGRTKGNDLIEPVNYQFSVDPPYTLQGTFADGLPDTAFLYDEYPDSNHPITPELTFAGSTFEEQREAALEDAKTCIVKFLLALTDSRVKYAKAPFDYPELFVPLTGTAPQNTGDRADLLANPEFLHLEAVGAAGRETPASNFLGILSTPDPNLPDHFDSIIPVTALSTVYEAEDAVLSGAVVSSAVGGYSGTGFADYINPNDDYIEWTVNVASAGQYELIFRYALASGNRPLEVSVNGGVIQASQSFPATGSFSNWSDVSVVTTLNAGLNIIRTTAIGSSGPNVDYLEVAEYTPNGIYEAEDAVLNGPLVSTAVGGYSGTGYADYINPSGDYIEWTVNVASAGQYELMFQYALGFGNRPLEIQVNGAVVVANQSFPSTGAWTNWQQISVIATLNAGSNTIRTTAIGSSGPNVDYLEIAAYAPPLNLYEAEDAVLSGAVVSSAISGYSGTGFVDYINPSGDYIEWSVNVASAGQYELMFQYALLSGDRPLEVSVNGGVVQASQSFPSTGAWTNWQTVTVIATLNAGSNTVRITAIGASGPNVDYLDVAPYIPSANLYEAEDAVLSGAVVSNAVGGYSGTGFVDYINPSGDYIEWTVNAPSAASYDLEFAYALFSGDRPLEISVNGATVVASQSFPSTGSWTNWQSVITNQALNAGSNTIRLTAIGSSGPNVDYLNIIP